MIWGYRFPDVEAHLLRLGYARVRTVDGIVIFRRGPDVFTIREPNIHGMLPETIVMDAFDRAELDPPPPASDYVD